MSLKSDYIISCGSSVASLNYLLSLDHRAKSIAILKPGLLNLRKFDLVVLPQHDVPHNANGRKYLAVTQGAPNLVDDGYLKEQSRLFTQRFDRLQYRQKFKIGFLLGGNTKRCVFDENKTRLLIKEIAQAAEDIDADILVTTSRRTPVRIENILQNELKDNPRCQAMIIANKENIPEAVGGILGLSDVLVVSADSISMISEAASSGKNTIIFALQDTKKAAKNKHNGFIARLSEQGHVLLADAQNIAEVIRDSAKNKIRTRPINDNAIILDAIKKII